MINCYGVDHDLFLIAEVYTTHDDDTGYGSRRACQLAICLAGYVRLKQETSWTLCPGLMLADMIVVRALSFADI